jgi:hypothetical protein
VGDALEVAVPAAPERFVRQMPKSPALPTAVWINRPEDMGGVASIIR